MADTKHIEDRAVAVEAAPSAPAPPAPPTSGRLAVIEVLAIPSFRFYLLATFSYFLVFGAQRFVFIWLVLQMSDSVGLAGVVGFALGIPAFLIMLPAGVWADRFHRGRMTATANAAGAAVTLTAAALVLAGVMSVPLALALAFAAGIANATVQPPLAAIVPSIVPRERLMNGIVLRTTTQNLAQIVGGAAGGAAIVAWGFEGAFGLLAAAYATAALCMLGVRLPRDSQAPAPGRRAMIPQIIEGLRFVFSNPSLRTLMLISIVSGLFMLGPVFVLVPEIARTKLGQEAFSAGSLFAITGAGMLVVSVLLVLRSRVPRRGLIFVLNMFAGAVVVAAMGLAPWYVLLAAVMFIWGMGGGVFINFNQTLIQEATPNQVMGRVMSIAGLSIAGVMPLGSLLAGPMAEWLGADSYLLICGAVLGVVALVTYLTQRDLVRLD
jgi:MFS family permease